MQADPPAVVLARERERQEQYGQIFLPAFLVVLSFFFVVKSGMTSFGYKFRM